MQGSNFSAELKRRTVAVAPGREFEKALTQK
jgi:hypothetical protein